MAAETTIIGDTRLILMPVRLDTAGVQAMEPELRSFCTEGPKKIVIDLSRTEYVASSGLRVILQMTRDLAKANGTVVLFGLRPPVRNIFDMAGFLSIFRICATRDEALEALK